MDVTVLTAVCWSFDVGLKVSIPRELSSWCQSYEAVYHSNHKERKLTWIAHVGVTIGFVFDEYL